MPDMVTFVRQSLPLHGTDHDYTPLSAWHDLNPDALARIALKQLAVQTGISPATSPKYTTLVFGKISITEPLEPDLFSCLAYPDQLAPRRTRTSRAAAKTKARSADASGIGCLSL